MLFTAQFIRKKKEPLSKVVVINDILYQTANHIDPDLHIIVQCPMNKHFLYTYKNVFPDVTEIPHDLTEPENELLYKSFINESIKLSKEQIQLRDFDSFEDFSYVDLDNTSFSTILFDDLPEIIKLPIAKFFSRSDDNNNRDLEYNYFEDTMSLNLSNTKDSGGNNCQDHVENIEDSDINNNIKECIDADNERNIYIFSSKYLTHVENCNLDECIRKRSFAELKESAKNIKQQLEKHVEYLKNSTIPRNSTLNTEERIKAVTNNSILTKKKLTKPKTVTASRKNCNNENQNRKRNVRDSKITLKNSKKLVSRSAKKKLIRDSVVLAAGDKVNVKNTKTCSNSRRNQKSANVLSDLPIPETNVVKEVRRSPRINSVNYKDMRHKFSGSCNNFNMSCTKTSAPEVHNKTTRMRKRSTLSENCIKPSIKPSQTRYRTNTKSNCALCLSFDGAKDSSSSEDERKEVGRRLRKRASDNSRYSALPISVSSPRSNSSFNTGKHPAPLSTDTNSKETKTPVNPQKNRQTVCDINVKRRLSFDNVSSLQTTLTEEKLVCTYSSEVKKEHIIDIHASDPLHVDSNSGSGSSNRDVINETSKSIGDGDKNLNTIHSPITYSSDSSDDETNRSFFKSPQVTNILLTAAEKYDKETNFIAREGTSKTLTPSDGEATCSQRCSGESSESSSFGQLTPYQRIVDERDLNLSTIVESNENELIDHFDDIFSSGNADNKASLPEVCHSSSISKYIITIPLKRAPTKEEVVNSLDKYKIPHIKQEEPFYSNVEDVTGSVEIGYNVLKISSRTTAHLPEFESQTDSINQYRKHAVESSNMQWKKSNIKNLILGFCKDRSCIVTPAKKPPSVQTVKNWIKEKAKKTVSTPEKKVEKVKIFVPLSPGNNNDDDDAMDISLTLSPCTPRSQSTSSQPTIQNTPKSAILEESTENCVKKTKITKGELSRFSTPSLRKSLLVTQDKSIINQSCQITGVTANNSYGFNNSIENLQAARAVVEHQNLTLLVMELHTRTRGDLKPNPEYDSICAIFYSVSNDVPDNHPKLSKSKGVVVINSLPLSTCTSHTSLLDGAGLDCNIDYVDSEENLINEFLKLIKYWDPDIIAGYEIEMLSWGYLIDRASIIGINLKPLLARTKDGCAKRRHEEGQHELQITGRIVLDVWRLMRHEIALQSYTFESIVYHILHKRVPQYPFRDLSFWWDHRSGLYRHRTAHYYLFRVVTILELFDKLDLIGRTSELARLFGIQFYEVLSRGSQFRVESMMLRLAKPLNYIPVSPSVQQRANMNAPEYISLVMEPESKLYNDPVIVLDFQSLYPSLIIAYNYCFTTCVGRVERLGKNTPFEFGATQLKISRKRLEKLVKKDLLNYSPCGAGFVKKEVRDGILPRMLKEILDTRLMVKNSMKENRDNQILQKVLHNRQLGLKLIANVTYGYTAANFSGRMPSVEVGDSVVSKGRETLQRAIEMVETTPEWGARVVYGDTDSLFVLVPGRSKEHAFEVGKKIADAVTKSNPDPVKLKLEKVYQPCILQTKKRYVGYMYESPDQKEPVYDAKGIETVRRDGCPAVSKMLEKCLKILFETKNISHVKKYVLRQFNKIIGGRVSIQDLTFAKEYRGAAGYRPGACVPALELTRKWQSVDKRNEPRSGQRVPYIIVNGPPGLPLIRLVRSPTDLLNDSSLRPNALYYITRVIIPPINRCFNLIGADLNTWFNQMPRKQLQYLPSSVSPVKKSTISQYFATASCAACGEQTQTGICDKCSNNPQVTTITLMEKIKGWEEKCNDCSLICQSCTSTQTEIKCVSLDCPVLYRRIQTNRDVQQATYVRQLLFSSDFLF